VTSEELAALLDHEAACRRAARAGAPLPPPPAGDALAGARALMGRVRSSAARNRGDTSLSSLVETHFSSPSGAASSPPYAQERGWEALLYNRKLFCSFEFFWGT